MYLKGRRERASLSAAAEEVELAKCNRGGQLLLDEHKEGRLEKVALVFPFSSTGIPLHYCVAIFKSTERPAKVESQTPVAPCWADCISD